MSFDFDLTIVIGFFILMLIVGLKHSRKITTIKNYALGNRNFSTAALVATIVATWASGSSFFITIENTYSDGLFYLLPSLVVVLELLLLAYIIIPRMEEFLGDISIAESMGKMYGKKVRIITAIAGIVSASGMIAIQFKVFANIFGYFSGFPPEITIIVAAFIVTIYSAFGGIKAVTYTDVIQFVAFGLSLPLIGLFIWNHAYDLGAEVPTNLPPKFDFSYVFNLNNSEFVQLIPLMIFYVIPSLDPVMSQRVLMGRDIAQVKKAFTIAAIIFLLIKLVMAFIPFVLFNINSNMETNQLIPYIIDNFTNSIGLKGILAVGIIAMAMSSADSYINSSSVLVSNDICSMFNFNEHKSLFISKIFSLTLGALSLWIAFSDSNLLSIVLSTRSYFLGIVTPPLLLSIFGFRSATKSVLIGMGAGFTTIILFKILNSNVNGIVMAILINASFLILSHYLLKQKGGWIQVEDSGYLYNLKSARQKQQNNFYQSIKEFSFTEFYKKNAPTNDLTYVYFGVFCIISTFITMSLTHTASFGNYKTTIIALYQIMLITGIIIAFYPIWPLSIKKEHKEKFIQTCWPITIFYMLFFFSTIFVIASNFNPLQFGLCVVSMIAAIILIGWRIALAMAMLGIPLGIQFYKYVANIDHIDIDGTSPQFALIYVVLIITSIILMFFKPKQEEEDTKIKCLEKEVNYTQRELANISHGIDFLQNQFHDKERKLRTKEIYLKDQLKLRNSEISKLTSMKDEFLRNITHESNAPMVGILSLCDVLYSCYNQLDNKNIKSAIKDIVNSGDRLKTYVNSIVDLSKLSSSNYKLTKESINLGKLAEKRTLLYKKVFSDDAKKQKFIFDIANDCIVNCDKYYIEQTIDNLISNAVNYGNNKPVTISIQKAEDNNISFSISDQGIGIPKTELLSIFAKFSVSSRTSTSAGGRGVGLALCKSVIEAHEGSISATSGDGVTILTFILQKN